MHIRRGEPDDYQAFVRLFAELAIPDPVPAEDRFVAGIVPLLTVACDDDGAVIGFVSWRAYGDLAHVMQLVVDPAWRGRRIGEQLLAEVRTQVRAAGCVRWYLNVKRDNAAAIKLYERVGMQFELESFAMRIAWARVPAVDVRERLATAADDAELAALFGVPVARIESFRARATFKLVVVLDEDDRVLGFGVFDPASAGAPMFCGRRPDVAAPLLSALRGYADPAREDAMIVVEGDRALAEAVRELGAELIFEILRLSGPA